MAALLTKKEVAEKMKVSERTIDNFRKFQSLPFIKAGRSIRFSEAAIDGWLEKKHLYFPPDSSDTDEFEQENQ